jgi:hypothetical protein
LKKADEEAQRGVVKITGTLTGKSGEMRGIQGKTRKQVSTRKSGD